MSGLHRVCCCEGGFCPCIDTSTYTYYADCTSTIDWTEADCDCLKDGATGDGYLYTAADGGYSCPQLTLAQGSGSTCATCTLAATGANGAADIYTVYVPAYSGGDCSGRAFSFTSYFGGWSVTVYPPDPSGTCSATNYADKWKAVVTLYGGVTCTYEADYTGCAPPKAWTLVSTTGVPGTGCQLFGALYKVGSLTYTIGSFTLSRV